MAIQPWKDLTDRFDKLSDWFDEFEEQVQRDLAATEGAEDTAAGADLSDTVVQVKDHLLKLSQPTPELLALGEAAGDMLGEEVCGEFPASEELRMSCEALAQRQERLKGQLELARQDVEQKVKESACPVVLIREIPLYIWVRGNHGVMYSHVCVVYLFSTFHMVHFFAVGCVEGQGSVEHADGQHHKAQGTWFGDSLRQAASPNPGNGGTDKVSSADSQG